MAGRRVLLVLGLALLSLATVPEVLAKHKKHVPRKHIPSVQQKHDEFADWVKRMGEKVDATGLKSDVIYAGGGGAEHVIIVDINGRGNFKSIQKAVDSIPDGSSSRYVLNIAPGTYKEKVKIPNSKGPITLQGSGNTATKLTYDDDANAAGGTLKSASVSVQSDDFICKDLTFENTSPSPAPGAVGKQAVAFMIEGDKAAFYRVAFLGFQDTLYDRRGRHYFKDCYIQGTIDYIFGDGMSYYDSCVLMTVATSSFGSLSAQKRLTSSDDTGYSFVNCWVGGTGYAYLSRAWGPYSRVVFIRTYLGNSIRPEGWFDWADPSRDKTVFYGEYQCYGPGSNRAGRAPYSLQLTDAQARPFLTAASWIQGNQWIPTGPQ